MTTEDAPPKKRNWIITICKILFAIAALILISITVLFNLGGSSDYLKTTMETYITQATGYRATIGKLNAATFFPELGFDFEDLELKMKPEDDIPVATAERVQLFFGFWDATSGNGRIKSFNIENAEAMPGAFTAKALRIKRGGIYKEGATAATMRFEGNIDTHKLLAEIGMEPVKSLISGDGYTFGKDNPFFAEVGDLRVEGRIGNTDSELLLKDIKASLAKQDVFNFDLQVSRAELGNLHVLGTVKLLEHGTVITPDLRAKNREEGLSVSGKIVSPIFHTTDFDKDSRLLKFSDFINSIMGYEPGSGRTHKLFFRDLDLNVTVQGFFDGEVNKGLVEKKVLIESTPFSVNPDSAFVAAFKKPAEAQP